MEWVVSYRHGHKEWEATFGRVVLRIEQNTPGYTLHTRGTGTFNWRRSLRANTLRECKAAAEKIASKS